MSFMVCAVRPTVCTVRKASSVPDPVVAQPGVPAIQAAAAAAPLDLADAFAPGSAAPPDGQAHAVVEEHEPGRVVRVKEHPAKPMTVDDALYEMELVGHDFFLFHDRETDRPTVVYRRHAYDYGLIRLA